MTASLALAAASIPLLPDDVAYDPYSWAIWGRELGHGHLDTRDSATAVKPLPMLFDTIFSFTGSHLPGVWLYAARVGAVLAFAAVFRLAWRLAGGWAAVVAVAGLAVSDQLLGYLFMRGMSEPWAVATLVAAVDCFLLGRRRAALGCLVATAYLRPEAWPLLLVFLLYLAWRRSWLQRLAALTVGVLVPFSWFFIDWVGSGQFNRSEHEAVIPTEGGPLLHPYPALTTFTETWRLASGPVVVLFVIGLAASLLSWWRHGRPLDPDRIPPHTTVAAVAFAWVAIEAVLAQAHLAAGLPRYLLPGEALGCVVAGWAVAVAARRAATLLRQRTGGRRRLAPAFALAAVLALVPSLIGAGRQWRTGINQGPQDIALAQHLTSAIRLAGGVDAIDDCGPVSTRNFQKPLVAWKLDAPLQDVHMSPLLSTTVLQQDRVPRIPRQFARPFHVVVTLFGHRAASSWRVLTICPR